MTKTQGGWWNGLLAFAGRGFRPSGEVSETFERHRPLVQLMPRRGGLFLDFVVLDMVATGSHSLIYKAKKSGSKELSALKIFRPDLIDDATEVERFIREREVLKTVEHPQIVKLRSEGALQGIPFEGNLRELPFMELDYLNGGCLAEAMIDAEECSPGTRLPPRRIIEIAISACSPLEALHANGMVHRDIKPSNLSLQRDGVVLIDFSAASVPSNFPMRSEPQWEGIGTIGFMSPEQARGEDPRPTDDIFSLGATLYRCAYGRSIYGQDQVERIHRKARAGWVNQPLSGQPKQLEELIGRATAAVAQDRFQSADDLKAALIKVLPHLPL